MVRMSNLLSRIVSCYHWQKWKEAFLFIETQPRRIEKAKGRESNKQTNWNSEFPFNYSANCSLHHLSAAKMTSSIFWNISLFASHPLESAKFSVTLHTSISIFCLILLSKTARPQQESIELYRTTPLIQLYRDTTFRQALMFLLVPVERGWRRNEQHPDQGGDKCMTCYRTSFFLREDVDISKSRVGTKWMAARWLL